MRYFITLLALIVFIGYGLVVSKITKTFEAASNNVPGKQWIREVPLGEPIQSQVNQFLFLDGEVLTHRTTAVFLSDESLTLKRHRFEGVLLMDPIESNYLCNETHCEEVMRLSRTLEKALKRD